MSILEEIQNLENQLVYGKLSEAQFDSTANKMENLTTSYIESSRPFIKPSKEWLSAKGDLYQVDGKLKFSLYRNSF